VGNGYGYGFVPVVGNGYGFGYVMKVVGTGIQRCYPRIVYPLPSLGLGQRRSLALELLAAVNNDGEELLQVVKSDKGVRGKLKRKEGEESAWRWIPPEAGEVAASGLNFNGGDAPSVVGFRQGVEGGKEGCCAMQLEASRERREGKGVTTVSLPSRGEKEGRRKRGTDLGTWERRRRRGPGAVAMWRGGGGGSGTR
jgi:hypothetical protein